MKKKTRAKRRKPTRPTPKPKAAPKRCNLSNVAPEIVQLRRSKGTPGRGGGPGGEAWKIEADGERAGVVFINYIDEPPIGQHASIQIFLNKTNQGRGIGRIGYRKACEASVYDTVYAHMRKSNLASRRAAEAAGFREVTSTGSPQLIMVRSRSPH
jgi:hypothetical protein